MTSFRRRRLVVDPFQYRMLWSSLLHFGAAGLLFGTILFLPLALQLAQPDLPVQQRAAIADQLLNLHFRVWPALAIMCVMVAIHSLINSHRVAGPLYRMRRVLASMAQGDYLPFDEIRKHDFLANQARALRRTMTAERDRLRSLYTGQKAIDRQLTELESALAAGSVSRAMAHAAQLRDDADRMATILDRLRLYPDEEHESWAAELRMVRSDEPGPPQARTGTDSGFSLLEIMIVSGLVATLSAIGVPAYTEALDTARVAKGIGDIDAISMRLEEMMTGDGLPGSLADIGYGDYLDPYGRTYRYHSNLGSGNAGARKDKFLAPLNSDFDVYSVGVDGESSAQIGNKLSRDDIIRAANGGFIGLAEDY